MIYRAEIDGLRALAVLPVIFFHAGFEIFGGGFVGVDVFFVISGYLITSIIISEISSNKFSIVNFYERRARRLLPALFFVMGVCIPFAWLWLTPSDLKDFGESLVAVSFFSSNILFWSESGYFDTTAELKPLLHTWSLAVEEQYYIIFPIFLLLSWRLGIRKILILLVIFFIISLSLANWGAYNKPSFTFFLLPTRGWEILIGVFTSFYLYKNSFIRSFYLNQFLSLSGLILIIFSIFIFNKNTPFPSLYALVPTLGTGLLILSAVPKTIAHNLLSKNFFVSIGLISYSAYLWHQPLLAFAKYRLVEDVSDLILIILCLSSIVIAWFSWNFIEKPFRNKKTISKKLIFIFSITGIIIFSSIGMSMHLKNGFNDRVSFSEELSKSFTRPLPEDCFGTPYNHYEEKWGCFLGDEKEEIDFILFGDSHSLSFKTLIDEKAKQNGINIFYTGAPGCLPFLGVHIDKDKKDQKQNNCNLLNERVYKLAKEKNIKGIILSARWSFYNLADYAFNGDRFISDNIDGPFSLSKSIENFSKLFDATVKKYEIIGVPLHLITQPPFQKNQPEAVFFNIAKGIGSIESMSVKKSHFEKLNKVSMNAFLKHKDAVNIYNLTDIFCGEVLCLIGDDEKSFYYDDDHLSNYGALKVEDIIENIFIDHSP
jgi:peptidoglycan/LPS O-acetylase OafA/YrhL